MLPMGDIGMMPRISRQTISLLGLHIHIHTTYGRLLTLLDKQIDEEEDAEFSFPLDWLC